MKQKYHCLNNIILLPFIQSLGDLTIKMLPTVSSLVRPNGCAGWLGFNLDWLENVFTIGFSRLRVNLFFYMLIKMDQVP
jgi:hypothetical protein